MVLWHRAMLRNPRLVGATVVFAALLFAPHILESVTRTGSPLGIITSAGEQVDTTEPIETAARYLGWLPAQLAHRLGFVVMVAGVVHAAIVALDALRRRDLTPAARRYLWLFVPAGVTTVGLIVQSHPEQRYVLFPVILAIIAGAGAVSAGVAWLRERPGLAGRQKAVDAAIIGGVLLVAVVAGSVGARRVVVIEREGDDSRWLPAVGRASRRTRTARARGDLGAADRRVVLPLRGRAVQQRRRGGPRSAAPSTTRPMSCSRTSTNAGRRPRPSSAFERCGRPTAIPVDGAPAGVEVYRLSP